MTRPERDKKEQGGPWTFREDPVTPVIRHSSRDSPLSGSSLRTLSLGERKGVSLSVLLLFIHNSRDFSRFSPNFAVNFAVTSQ
jgi:hypothetical protein